MEIDLNRGVTIKTDPSSGARVYMYKDTPGVFLNIHGHTVADSLAAGCGFPIKELKKLRDKRVAMERASAEIEAEFESEKATVGKEKVIKQSEDGYKIVQYAFGRCWVFGPDGDKLHDKPLTKQEALHLFKVIREEPTEPEEPAKAEVKPKDKGDANGT